MPGARRGPRPLSDDWMLEQQVRAEIEAETWRRLRLETAQAAPPALPAPEPDPHATGSLTLKALVRFLLGAGGGYLAYLAATDAGLGEFETWLALGAGFLITLALSAFGPLRRAVHLLAETARWAIVVAAGLGALWLLTHPPGA